MVAIKKDDYHRESRSRNYNKEASRYHDDDDESGSGSGSSSSSSSSSSYSGSSSFSSSESSDGSSITTSSGSSSGSSESSSSYSSGSGSTYSSESGSSSGSGSSSYSSSGSESASSDSSASSSSGMETNTEDETTVEGPGYSRQQNDGSVTVASRQTRSVISSRSSVKNRNIRPVPPPKDSPLRPPVPPATSSNSPEPRFGRRAQNPLFDPSEISERSINIEDLIRAKEEDKKRELERQQQRERQKQWQREEAVRQREEEEAKQRKIYQQPSALRDTRSKYSDGTESSESYSDTSADSESPSGESSLPPHEDHDYRDHHRSHDDHEHRNADHFDNEPEYDDEDEDDEEYTDEDNEDYSEDPEDSPRGHGGAGDVWGGYGVNNKEPSQNGSLGQALAGVPLRRVQSPTTTISSLSASQITGAFSMNQKQRIEQAEEEDSSYRRANEGNTSFSTSGSSRRSKRSKKSSRGPRSVALEDLEANLNDTLQGLDQEESRKGVRELVAQELDDDQGGDSTLGSGPHTSHHLLHGFEALLGALLQLSDELELISTFGTGLDPGASVVSSDALNAVLGHAPTLDQIFSSLKPILQHYLDEEPDEEMDHLLSRAQKLVRLLCELTFRVCQRQEWNPRAETAFVTLLEMLERTTLEITCGYDDQSVPEYQLSGSLRQAWAATGHVEELKTLYVTNDTWLFRQVCYDVLVSTDQWCPNTRDLANVCDVANSAAEDDINAPSPDIRLAPTPPAAAQILDKVNGDPLPRAPTMASILRRILPPHAVTDPAILDNYSSVRSKVRNPMGTPGSGSTIAISSVPEVLNDPNAMGMAGVGKTTIAAMVANHTDVRRFFKDGVAWVHLGQHELTYTRYTQCLKELASQLVFYDGVPLFAELLHTPGEPRSKRQRREEGFMVYARDTVSELLHRRNILIVLDDVYFESDLEWFQFTPATPTHIKGKRKSKGEIFSSSLVITTRIGDLLPAADTVEIDLLDESEAIKLLVTESGQSSDHVMAESREARSVVRECANHPLAVKSVGRWLSLKHATAGVISSVEEIHEDVAKSIDRILSSTDPNGADMMYEILSMSFSPAVNGEPTKVIKFCFAAFVKVFCREDYLSEYAATAAPPMIPWTIAELLFDTLLEMEEERLFEEGSLFYSQRKEATILIPEALSALGVLKLITTYEIDEDESMDSSRASLGEEKYLQIMHAIQQEYGEYLSSEETALKELTRDSEMKWNTAFVKAYLEKTADWDSELPDAGRDYALEMIVSHMIRAQMYYEATQLLADESFVRGRIYALGREIATRRHIADCETLFTKVMQRSAAQKAQMGVDPRGAMIAGFEALGSALASEDAGLDVEDKRLLAIESGRAHYEIGFSLAEQRCWSAAIAHWERSQELLLSSLGMVEFVAAILYNVGVVYAEMNEYEQALASLKQCLRIRGAIHGEEHILYAQTIQKIGDVFLGMSDYTEAMESYNWAMDVMHIEPSHHRVDIGDILDNMGNIHYSKGEVHEALRCYQDALRSKKVELGDDHPELAVTYQHIGNCLSDQGDTDEAIAHFEEAIRLKELDPDGGEERDADVASIQGVLNNLTGRPEEGLRCYEQSLAILVAKVPHKKEKIAALLHLIGCVHLMNGEHKKAMKLFEESLQARRKVLGFVHLDVASTLFNMAFLHQSKNRLDKALKCLEEALKIRQLRLRDSEKVALTHEKIGTLAKAIGKSKKAEISFEEALRIRRLIHGDDHEAVATVLHEMGDLMDDLGEYDEAMNNYVDALNIRRKRLGRHEDVAATLYSMGFTLHNQDASERAFQCFEEALSIRKERLGEEAKEVGDTLNMMGFLQAKRGELDSALSLLWDALRIRKAHKDEVKVSETLKNIGNVHREKQEHELAVECYEECLRIRRSELGDDHEKVADALIAIGNVRSDMEEVDSAMRAYREAYKIRSLVHGENDERVAAVLQYMGTLEFRSGDLDNARIFLQDFISIRQENQAEYDGDYVNVLFVIGNIYKIQGDDEKAKRCWSEAYQVFQELGLASENPQIARVMDSLLHRESRSQAPPPSRPQSKKGGPVSQSKSRKKGFFGSISSRFKDALRDEKMPKYASARKIAERSNRLAP